MTALEHSDLESFWYPGHDVLVWALFLGVHISAGRRERPWFIVQLARGARFYAGRSWDEVRTRALGRCFFVERVYGESFREI